MVGVSYIEATEEEGSISTLALRSKGQVMLSHA